ncbi:MAG: DegT/DnrJ/EryC1/StrS family aminotransferase [Gaiellaceae bacterium]
MERPTVVRAGLRVPFFDLGPSHGPLKEALLAEIAGLVDSGDFSNGPQVAEFEQAFAAYCGAPTCVGTASGLDALRFALIAADVGPGDDVLVPANTFVATLEAVSQAGATPVPVDVSATDYNLDPAAAAAAVSARTRALIPVHLYGQMADMRALHEMAVGAELVVVEDACQAHGASRDGVRPGELADAAAFSFYPGKNLGAMGDAGALITGDEPLAELVRALREHGQTEKYRHRFAGYTSRLDTIHALVLLHKLPLLSRWNQERTKAAAFYLEGLDGVGDIRLPPVAEGSTHVWHLFAIRTAHVEELAAFLAERGISTGRHYPEPPHLSAAYAHLGHARGEFPLAEQLADELLSLPLYPGITEAQLAAVMGGVADFFDGG